MPMSAHIFGLAGALAISLLTFGAPVLARQSEPEQDEAPLAPRSTFSSASERIKAWRDDLSQLRRELPKLHINLFAECSREEWVNLAADLDRRMETLSDPEVRVELSRLVARIGDGHTAIHFPPSEADRFLPLFVEKFADGWYITAATMDHRDLLEHRVVEIGGKPVADLVEQIGQITSSDNPFGRDLGATWRLTNIDTLTGLGLVEDGEQIAVKILPPRGGREKVVNLPAAKVNRQSLVRAPDNTPGKDEALPVSLREHNRPYGHRMIGFGAMYAWYDSCRNQPRGATVMQWSKKLLDDLDKSPPERVIVDLRRNGGGDASLLDPLIRQLGALKQAGKFPGGLYVLIGSGTMSAAQRNTSTFKLIAKATLVGTPTGQGPRRFGAIRVFTLDNCGAQVSYSTRRWGAKLPPLAEGEIDTVSPDVLVPRDAALHFAGRDPALEAALMHDGAR